MFARILEFVPLVEKKGEFIRVVRKEVLPILKKQDRFLEILPLVPDIKTEKVLAVTLWTDKKELERNEHEWSRTKTRERMASPIKSPSASTSGKLRITSSF